MDITKLIDHTLLKPEASKTQIKKVCDEAKQYGFMSVCVNPARVEFTAKELAGSGVAVCCVIGFPLGATLSDVKAFEAKRCIELGANEVDMVINIGAAKDGDWQLVESDIKAVVDAAKGRALVKVIIETCLLTDDEKIKMCEIVSASGADYIKTSTGFGGGGATREDVALFAKHIGPNVKIKAAGGIADLNDAKDFIALGADRLGTSRIVKAVKAMEK